MAAVTGPAPFRSVGRWSLVLRRVPALAPKPPATPKQLFLRARLLGTLRLLIQLPHWVTRIIHPQRRNATINGAALIGEEHGRLTHLDAGATIVKGHDRLWPALSHGSRPGVLPRAKNHDRVVPPEATLIRTKPGLPYLTLFESLSQEHPVGRLQQLANAWGGRRARAVWDAANQQQCSRHRRADHSLCSIRMLRRPHPQISGGRPSLAPRPSAASACSATSCRRGQADPTAQCHVLGHEAPEVYSASPQRGGRPRM